MSRKKNRKKNRKKSTNPLLEAAVQAIELDAFGPGGLLSPRGWTVYRDMILDSFDLRLHQFYARMPIPKIKAAACDAKSLGCRGAIPSQN